MDLNQKGDQVKIFGTLQHTNLSLSIWVLTFPYKKRGPFKSLKKNVIFGKQNSPTEARGTL